MLKKLDILVSHAINNECDAELVAIETEKKISHQGTFLSALIIFKIRF